MSRYVSGIRARYLAGLATRTSSQSVRLVDIRSKPMATFFLLASHYACFTRSHATAGRRCGRCQRPHGSRAYGSR